MIQSQRRIGLLDACVVFLSVLLVSISMMRSSTPHRVVEVIRGDQAGSFVLPNDLARTRRIEKWIAAYGDHRKPARLGAHRFVVETASFYQDQQLDSAWNQVSADATVRMASYERNAGQSIEPTAIAPIQLGGIVAPRIGKAAVFTSMVIATVAVIFAALLAAVFPAGVIGRSLVVENENIELPASCFGVKQSPARILLTLAVSALPFVALAACF